MPKIYTRKGDDGFTSLAGGTKVRKNDIRVEAYGTLDELIANLSLLHNLVNGKDSEPILSEVLHRLMDCAAVLAACGTNHKLQEGRIDHSIIEKLENKIDKLSDKLPELTSFIIPGGNVVVSQCHICRTVCRRAERTCVSLSEKFSFDGNILRFLNRLSDYLFVLSRSILYESNIGEILWKSKI